LQPQPGQTNGRGHPDTGCRLSLSLPLPDALVFRTTADYAKESRTTAQVYTHAAHAGEVRGTMGIGEEAEAMLTPTRTEIAAIAEGIGDAGSRADAERVVLRDGSSVVICPLVAGNEAAVTGWLTCKLAHSRWGFSESRLCATVGRSERAASGGLRRARPRRCPPGFIRVHPRHRPTNGTSSCGSGPRSGPAIWIG